MKRQSLITAALLVSIAANLFFIGGISYRLLTVRDLGDARPLPPNVGWILRDLTEERRAELANRIEAGDTQIRALRREMFAAQRRVNESMTAAEFSPGQLAAALAELREIADRYQRLSHEQTVAIFAQLTAAERQGAMEFLSRIRPSRRGAPGAGGNRPPPPR